jgi:hypothetical protein
MADDDKKLRNVPCCPKCWTESMGNTVLLDYDPKTETYQCKNKPTHRFKMDENGFLTTVK